MKKYRRPEIPYDNPPPVKNQNTPYPKNTIANNNNDKNNNNNTNKMFLLQKRENRINSNSLPRPSEFEDYYENLDKKNIFYSSVGAHPPHSTSKYFVIETENSSCRIIRSSLVKLPVNQSLLLKTGVLFGLYCQPFAEFNGNEKKIPVIDGSKGIFRCKSCNSYINNKYNLTYFKNNQRILICNICQIENVINNNDAINEKYFLGDNQENLELINPTIDFIPPENLTKKQKNLYHIIV